MSAMTSVTPHHDDPASSRADLALGGVPLAPGRDPAGALYEEAAGLLSAARALEAASRVPGALAALGPTLACVEASLDALAEAATQLGDRAVRRLSWPPLTDHDMRTDRTEAERRFGRLVSALEEGRDACTRSRASVGPIVAELTAL
jgi:hypothetical protein